jgi:glycosyltransferase involved in cell wall biosynthesis
MTKVKVYFTQGDMINWAVDADLRHIRHALGDGIIESSLAEADLIFASWWAPLVDMDPALLRSKRVLCCMHGDLYRFLMTPTHRVMFDLVSLWIARSEKTKQELDALGHCAAHVPYWGNTDEFYTVPAGDPSLKAMSERLGPKNGRYLIANFGRDSEGSDLTKPKLVKGPDMFAYIMKDACDRGLRVEAVLAGPRRHWLRRRLEQMNVPHRFIGEAIETDDLTTNTLSRDDLNLLYNLVDLTIVSSRSEGGPLAVCEAPLAGCKLISTPVGMAPERLPAEVVFRSCEEAVNVIEEDVRSGGLKAAKDLTRAALAANNSTKAMTSALEAAFSVAIDMDPPGKRPSGTALQMRKFQERVGRIFARPLGATKKHKIGFADGFQTQNTAYCSRHIIDLISPEEDIRVASSGDKPHVMFLDALSDYPFIEASLLPDKYYLVLRDTYSRDDISKVVANVASAVVEKRFAGTISPTLSCLDRLARLGCLVPKPVLVPPTATTTLGGYDELTSVLSLGGTDADSHAMLSSRVERDVARIEDCSNVPIKPILHIELGDDVPAVQRSRFAVEQKIPVVYRSSKDLEIVVGLGGLPFESIQDAPAVIDRVLRQRSTFSSLSMPMTDDAQVWLNCIRSA